MPMLLMPHLYARLMMSSFAMWADLFSLPQEECDAEA